jgi:hypothetical protein
LCAPNSTFFSTGRPFFFFSRGRLLRISLWMSECQSSQGLGACEGDAVYGDRALGSWIELILLWGKRRLHQIGYKDTAAAAHTYVSLTQMPSHWHTQKWGFFIWGWLSKGLEGNEEGASTQHQVTKCIA